MYPTINTVHPHLIPYSIEYCGADGISMGLAILCFAEDDAQAYVNARRLFPGREIEAIKPFARVNDFAHNKRYVVFSQAEYLRSDDGAGFWNSNEGWTTACGASLFEESQMKSGTLPCIGNPDAAWFLWTAANQPIQVRTEYYVWCDDDCENKTSSLEEAIKWRDEFIAAGRASWINDSENNYVTDGEGAQPQDDALTVIEGLGNDGQKWQLRHLSASPVHVGGVACSFSRLFKILGGTPPQRPDEHGVVQTDQGQFDTPSLNLYWAKI